MPDLLDPKEIKEGFGWGTLTIAAGALILYVLVIYGVIS